tara:strand:+ start:222 stop:1259 length:1038 start_codon:yes stop_codon:yes gene_type:complete
MSKIGITTMKVTDLISSKEKFKLPECQRNLDSEQVNKMLEYQTKFYEKYNEYFFPTPIVVGMLNDDYYVIDGQHRCECVRHIYNKTQSDFDIPITVIKIENMEELDEMYSKINSNKPVPIINEFKDWKNFSKFIEGELINKCRKYLSNSMRPQIPNINSNNLISYLNEKKIGEKVHFDYKKFLEEMWKLNLYISRTYSTSVNPYFKSNIDISKYIEKCKDKNKLNPLFLGIFKKYEWVDFIVKSITENLEYCDMNLTPIDLRVNIKKATRSKVWKKRSDKFTGNCYVCNEIISYDNFECGHIQSVFNLGCTAVSNLEPICSSCNLNMGIQNLMDYKRELELELNN